ncbi:MULTISPECIES: DUF2269 family protein [Rhodoplanes]|nr:DUF2269 family protein [Rhodoplanes serenus]
MDAVGARATTSGNAMDYGLLRFFHILGAVLIGAGLVGVWMSDLRARQLRRLEPFAEAVRSIAVFYDGLVVPGALLLMASGGALIATVYGGLDAFRVPWIAGMVALFAFEFIEGNTVTRLYFMRLRRLSRAALESGHPTAELERAREAAVPAFTHFLDLPLFVLIVALATLRPESWTAFGIGAAVAVTVATGLTLLIPRLYPWTLDASPLPAARGEGAPAPKSKRPPL